MYITNLINLSTTNKFTIKFVNFLDKSNFFNWILDISHGVDKSTGLPDYNVWWDDVILIKKKDKIIMKHIGGEHNIMIPTSQILSQAIVSYLSTNNKTLEKIINQYSKGITATIKGMLWNKDDNEKYIMARNIIPKNHTYKTKKGIKSIDYSLIRNEKKEWNAQRIHFPHNPYWGDIYITNMRSKDDLPHILRAVSFMYFIKDEINSAKETYEYIKEFCKDVVKHHYCIRTKGKDGKTFCPKKDLSNFTKYSFIPYAENNAKLTLSLMAFGNSNIKHKDGNERFYEYFAVKSHYFNYKIINGFHMTAILQALINKKEDIAEELLIGLKKRADKLMKSNISTNDLAVFLVQASSLGMTLSEKQVKIIYSEFSKAIDYYKNFNRWDMWSDSIKDGVYYPNGGYKPINNNLVKPEEICFLLEQCYSPYSNMPIINPDIVDKLLI